MNYNDYSGLGETGYEGKDVKAPEEEFFHSLYISGQTRKNHREIIEQAGQLQIRGVDYNKPEVFMIITHVKTVLVKTKTIPGKNEITECFSYQSAKPWKGTCGKECGANSAARAADPYCSSCKSNIIVAGILCEANGKPKTQEGKPVFVFIRGKGVKYGSISDYMTQLYKMDLDPIFLPATDESKRFEKSIVNHKRFVTKVGIGTQNTNFGIKNVFDLTKGKEISKDNVQKILQVAKDTLERFNEKFDWSRTMKTSSQQASSSYVPQGSNDDLPTFDSTNESTPDMSSQSSQSSSDGDSFNFEDIDI